MHQNHITEDWGQYIDLEKDEYLYKYSYKEMFAPSNISFTLADVEIDNPEYYFDDNYKPFHVSKRSIKEDMESDDNLKQNLMYIVSMIFIATFVLILS